MERPHRPRHRPSRPGFTLVELLVVILIIAALLTLLVPTVAAAFRKAKEAQVAAEMNNLATALASFKTTYNDYPPSRVLLAEAGYTADLLKSTTPLVDVAYESVPGATLDPNPTDLSVGQLAQRSLTYLRKFWPRCDFSGNDANYFNDFNGNGTSDANYIISGSECLTFFLGGMPLLDPSGLVLSVNGFSKSPTHPFVALGVPYPTSVQMTKLSVAASNRTVPNYEFVNSRLIDQDGDHIPSYIDPLDLTPGNRRSYAYFFSYGNNNYDPNDVNGYGHAYSTDPAANYEQEEDSSTTIFVERGFQVSFPVYASKATDPAKLCISPGPNPYTSGPPTANTVAWLNSSSFQIICAGHDRNWGLGGTYAQNSLSGTGKLPINPNANDPGNIHGDDTTGVRLHEADNVTNFSGGRLD